MLARESDDGEVRNSCGIIGANLLHLGCRNATPVSRNFTSHGSVSQPEGCDVNTGVPRVKNRTITVFDTVRSFVSSPKLWSHYIFSRSVKLCILLEATAENSII